MLRKKKNQPFKLYSRRDLVLMLSPKVRSRAQDGENACKHKEGASAQRFCIKGKK